MKFVWFSQSVFKLKHKQKNSSSINTHVCTISVKLIFRYTQLLSSSCTFPSIREISLVVPFWLFVVVLSEICNYILIIQFVVPFLFCSTYHYQKFVVSLFVFISSLFLLTVAGTGPQGHSSSSRSEGYCILRQKKQICWWISAIHSYLCLPIMQWSCCFLPPSINFHTSTSRGGLLSPYFIKKSETY